MKPSIYDYSFDELARFFADLNMPKYRVDQLWNGLYHDLSSDPQKLTTFPQALRDLIESKYYFKSLALLQELESKDGETQKVLFKLLDGKGIETVRMMYRKRRTLCISSQAGCAMGCSFCATGQMGLLRNLTPGEIVEQVIFFSRLLKQTNDRVTNIVIMGMGEPFHNYNHTMKAIDILNDSKGMNIGARRITVSTVGLIPGIRRFTKEKRQVNLAISLHAATDDLRTSMLPINKKYPLDQLMAACKEYVQVTHRRISFEWALINNVNDTIEQAKLLVDRLDGMLCHVNLIPLNPTDNYEQKNSPIENISRFKNILIKSGIPTTVRLRRGIDINAGCGQLAIKEYQ